MPAHASSSSTGTAPGSASATGGQDGPATVAGGARDTAPTPGGRKAELFNDVTFRALRAYAQVPDDCVDTGWSLASLASGGGKGGTAMAHVGSGYIVKELSKSDHNTLLKITSSYAQHVRSEDGTLLSPIYMHFRDIETDRFFFVMRNAIGSGPFSALYDLKGCADDKAMVLNGEKIPAVHKRVWNFSLWGSKYFWSSERRRYYAGKLDARNVRIACTTEQRKMLITRIGRDVAWLKENRLMDYSLLVATKTWNDSTATGGVYPSVLGPGMLRKRDNKTELLYVSIIDFLQLWTTGKKVAMYLKFAERNKATVPPAQYGDRFLKHFTTHIIADAEAVEVPPAANAAAPRAVAPSAGDTNVEGNPEDSLQTPVTSRPQERVSSRSGQMPRALETSHEENADGGEPLKHTLQI